MSREIVINNDLEKSLVKSLEARTDIKAERIKRLLRLPDLTKKANSPVKILLDQILQVPRFKDFDLVDFPRIVTVEENFDLLNTPKDHPSRRETDTYYVDDNHVLRTQMTVMWSYYLKDKNILEQLEKEGEHDEAKYIRKKGQIYSEKVQAVLQSVANAFGDPKRLLNPAERITQEIRECHSLLGASGANQRAAYEIHRLLLDSQKKRTAGVLLGGAGAPETA